MISLEKSVSTWQFPVNKVIKFGPCWEAPYLWLVTYCRISSENGGRNKKTPALKAGAPFPFLLFRAFLSLPTPSPLPFLRLPRRLGFEVRRRYSYRWLSPWAAKCSNRYFSELEEHSGIFAEKKSCVLCRNFISIYKINRTFHGRLGIRILSSRADRHFQHSKIKFASPRGHVISSISAPQKQQRNELQKQVRNIRSVRMPVLSNQTTIWH